MPPKLDGRCLQRLKNIGRLKQAPVLLLRNDSNVFRKSIISNNITSITYVNHNDGRCKTLSEIATSIRAEAFIDVMSIQCAHIAGRKNLAADYWSCTIDMHNWMLHPKLLQSLKLRTLQNRPICKLSFQYNSWGSTVVMTNHSQRV